MTLVFPSRVVLQRLFWAAGDSLIPELMVVVASLVLARHVSTAEFGVVAFVSAVLAFGAPIARGGFGARLIQSENESPIAWDTAFWMNMAIGLLLASMVYIAAPKLAALFDEPTSSWVLQVMSTTLITSAASAVPMAKLHREQRFKQIALCNIIGAAVGLATAFIVLLTVDAFAALVALNLAGAMASCAALWVSARWVPNLQFGGAAARDLICFGAPLIVSHLSRTLSLRIDILVITSLMGLSAVGVYALANRVSRLFLVFLAQPISTVALPHISRLRSNSLMLRSTVRRTSFRIVLASLAFVGLAPMALPEVIDVLFGPTWSEVRQVLTGLTMGAAIFSVNQFHLSCLTALGRPAYSMYAGLTALVLTAGATGAGAYMDSMVAISWARSVALLPVFGMLLFGLSAAGVSVLSVVAVGIGAGLIAGFGTVVISYATAGWGPWYLMPVLAGGAAAAIVAAIAFGGGRRWYGEVG